MVCKCARTITVQGKTDDRCHVDYSHAAAVSYTGYVPEGLYIGDGDYLRVEFCADCGKVQGNFPIEDGHVRDALETPEDEE